MLIDNQLSTILSLYNLNRNILYIKDINEMKSLQWERVSIYTSMIMFVIMLCLILPTTISSLVNLITFALVNPNRLIDKMSGNYALIISCLLLGIMIPVNIIRQWYFKKRHLSSLNTINSINGISSIETINSSDSMNSIEEKRKSSDELFCIIFLIIDIIIFVGTSISLIIYISAEIEFPGKWETVDVNDVMKYEETVCFISFVFSTERLSFLN